MAQYVEDADRKRYEKQAREFLLNGGAGFEGTPEASTFGFEGAIDCMVSWRMSVEAEAHADEETWKAMEELGHSTPAAPETVPDQPCSICGKVTNPMFMCDEDPLDTFYCIEHWPMMECSKGAHGEGCPTSVFTSESPAKLSTTDWLRERLENCERLAKECTEADKQGWLQDADYFRDAIRLICLRLRAETPRKEEA